MKRLLNIVLLVLGVGFLSSCSTTGSTVRGVDAYGYYDNVYYYGYPNYYRTYPHYQRPVIHNDVIVIPEQKRNVVRNRENVRSRKAISPNTRRSVTPSNREVIRNTAPTRRSSTVAPSSRSVPNATPAPRSNLNNSSRRGNN